MKACLLLLASLALVSLAQKEDCDWEKEMMCFNIVSTYEMDFIPKSDLKYLQSMYLTD